MVHNTHCTIFVFILSDFHFLICKCNYHSCYSLNRCFDKVGKVFFPQNKSLWFYLQHAEIYCTCKQLYKIPLDTPSVKENCKTNFKKTSLSSSGAIHPTSMCLASAFMEVRPIAPDEERLVLSKLVVQFSFTYGVYQEVFYIFVYTLIGSFFI